MRVILLLFKKNMIAIFHIVSSDYFSYISNDITYVIKII